MGLNDVDCSLRFCDSRRGVYKGGLWQVYFGIGIVPLVFIILPYFTLQWCHQVPSLLPGKRQLSLFYQEYNLHLGYMI